MDFHLNVPPPVQYLDSAPAFNDLTPEEQRYTFEASQASWVGGLIDLLQTSPESAKLFLLMQRVFSSIKPDKMIKLAEEAGFSEEEITSAMSYFATVYGNLGNYHSFGDSKFVPRIPVDRLKALLSSSGTFSVSGIEDLFDELAPAIYSLKPHLLHLGFGPNKGLTTYYSANCDSYDSDCVQEYLKHAKIEAYNTRVFKEKDPALKYKLRFASADKKCIDVADFTLSNGVGLQLEYGDYAPLMQLLVESCKDTASKALNTTQRNMWLAYAESFLTGNVDDHKAGSRLWVKDKNPAVECYIGFIENYRDPAGMRAEFEGFVAAVNKSVSAKFQRLVDNSTTLLPQLPWSAGYEKDKFLQPDFTSIDIITYACSGIPAGINIPNYDDVRQVDGFKNVSLGNVLATRFKDPKADFLTDADKAVYLANIAASFDVQVGLHELLGHGSGKLFRSEADGSVNFDQTKVKDMLTDGPVTKWYDAGDSYDSKFGFYASPYEECRAECVGLYLCNLSNVLAVFGHTDTCDGVPDIVYVNWLSMVRSAVLATEFYSPASSESAEAAGDAGGWRQAHCCARYAILRVFGQTEDAQSVGGGCATDVIYADWLYMVLLEVGSSLLRIETIDGSDGKPDLEIVLNREAILSLGRPAIGKFLGKLQYFKSTGQSTEGIAFFRSYADLAPAHLAVRQIVIDRKRPRPILVLPVLKLSGNGAVTQQAHAATYAGMIESFVDRFSAFPRGQAALEALDAVCQDEKKYFEEIVY